MHNDIDRPPEYPVAGNLNRRRKLRIPKKEEVTSKENIRIEIPHLETLMLK